MHLTKKMTLGLMLGCGLSLCAFEYEAPKDPERLLCYEQYSENSCGAAASILALKEVGYQLELNEEQEKEAYKVTGLSDDVICKLAVALGVMSEEEAAYVRENNPELLDEYRYSLPEGVQTYLTKAEANARYLFSPLYLQQMRQSAAFDGMLKVMGDMILTHAQSAQTEPLNPATIQQILTNHGRLVVPFVRSDSAHYFVLRLSEGELVAMDPGLGENVTLDEDFLSDALQGETVDIGDDEDLRFFGVMFSVEAPK